MNESDTNEKLKALRARLLELESVLVCHSGGLDSSLLLVVAHDVLKDKVVAVTAIGPALAPRDLDAATQLARQLGVRQELVEAGELSDPQYTANAPDRCFHCKRRVYEAVHRLQERLGLRAVVNGTNVDDLADYRPGLDAANDHSVKSPLLECGFTKNDVRKAAKQLDLSFWSKPASACLASRIPYGVPITRTSLQQIAGLEAELQDLGLRQVRVRHHETIARIEVEPNQIAQVATDPLRARVLEAGKRHGYAYITLDLGGYRMGSNNEVLSHLRAKVPS